MTDAIPLDQPKRERARAEVPDARPPEFSDESLALRFADRHVDDLRFVSAWNKWLRWDGCRWRFDDTLAAFDLARVVCRKAAAECNKDTIAKRIASAQTVAAVERLAKADRRLAAVVEQWDADPWLLNTPGGIIDLRIGERRPPDRSTFCTKVTTVAPKGECPLWHRFLDRVAAGDDDLKLYLQRMAGYCLTGITREHALFFLYGTGANGKSVFINTVAGLLGDYAATAPMDTFMSSGGERHPTELASLRGARLVTATETEQGRRWAEAKIKALTGGDRIAARYMRQNFFEFTPTFKLLIVGNHKPGLRSIDEAIRRRLHLIPFTVTIPEHERDETLTDQLKAEWPAILAWAIAGASDWAGEGLRPPQAVRVATDAYLDTEDATTQWLDERCTLDPQTFATAAELFTSWRLWAEKAGEFVGSAKRLSQTLEDRGFVRDRQGHDRTRGFRGLLVRAWHED